MRSRRHLFGQLTPMPINQNPAESWLVAGGWWSKNIPPAAETTLTTPLVAPPTFLPGDSARKVPTRRSRESGGRLRSGDGLGM
jgi:hypothetical protein